MFIRSFFIILSILLISCNDHSLQEMDIAIHADKPITISDIEVLKKELVLNPIEGAWYYKNELFSGYSLRIYPNDTLAEKIGYIQGKREGIAQKWSENGTLRIESYYKNNRLDSTYKSWWENGVLASQSNYSKGVKEGVEREWYATGVLAKQRNLDNGQESGLQKAWLENGTLYVNYEARNGRIFGMRKANSCYKLEDEIIITK